jgi:hypothetical protein
MVQIWLLCNESSLATTLDGHSCHCFGNPCGPHYLLARFKKLQQSLSFGGSIFMYVLLAFLLCKQKQLLHVLRQNLVLSSDPKLHENL